MINRRALPKGCVPSLLDHPVTSTTLEGSFMTKTSVRLKGIILPEFDCNKPIDDQGAFVFDRPLSTGATIGLQSAVVIAASRCIKEINY